MSSSSVKSENESRKPADTAFKQQRLKAWQPFLTPRTVLPTFFAIGIIFIPIGIILVVQSNNINEISLDYTNCSNGDQNCWAVLGQPGTNTSQSCNCTLSFDIPVDWDGPIFMYYGLDNFYQNHRRYVKSRDDNQLIGYQINAGGLSSSCDPYRDLTLENNTILNYAPCGLIANSMFNDTFKLERKINSTAWETIPLSGKGIAWKSDVEVKFNNPPPSIAPTPGAVYENPLSRQSRFNNTIRPPFWQTDIWNLGYDDENKEDPAPMGWGYENEDFITWMRPAGLPNFRKLYRKVNNEESLVTGEYRVFIQYRFPTSDFDSRKHFILSSTSLMGGKNPFLGYAYIAVGALCLLLGFLFLLQHIINPRALGDHRYLKWSHTH